LLVANKLYFAALINEYLMLFFDFNGANLFHICNIEKDKSVNTRFFPTKIVNDTLSGYKIIEHERD